MEKLMQMLMQMTKKAQQEMNNALNWGWRDEVEAYLHAFETTAAQEGWPKAQWVGLLAPFLSGEALKAFQDLETSVA